MRTTNLSAPALERQARRQAGTKLGWYIHAFVYVTVNLMLVLLSTVSGKNWAIFPALARGLGLAIHGMVVPVCMRGLFSASVSTSAPQSRISPMLRTGFTAFFIG